MNKTLTRGQTLLALHLALVVIASAGAALAYGVRVGYYPLTVLDPSTVQRDMTVSVRPASASVRRGASATLTVRLDKQGQVPTFLSMSFAYPAENLAIGEVSSPDPACQQTLRVTRASGTVLVECYPGPSTAQLQDEFSLPYVASKAGSASVDLVSAGSAARGPAGTLRLQGLGASLTITP